MTPRRHTARSEPQHAQPRTRLLHHLTALVKFPPQRTRKRHKRPTPMHTPPWKRLLGGPGVPASCAKSPGRPAASSRKAPPRSGKPATGVDKTSRAGHVSRCDDRTWGRGVAEMTRFSNGVHGAGLRSPHARRGGCRAEQRRLGAARAILSQGQTPSRVVTTAQALPKLCRRQSKMLAAAINAHTAAYAPGQVAAYVVVALIVIAVVARVLRQRRTAPRPTTERDSAQPAVFRRRREDRQRPPDPVS